MIIMGKTLSESSALYADLLKKTLTNWVHGHEEWARVELIGRKARLAKWLLPSGLVCVKPSPFNPEKREMGQDWPEVAHTMIGLKRLNNLQFCIEQVVADDIPGDFIETGVWRGGSVIFMRGMLKALGVTDRRVWVADSFEGLPKPDADKYPEDSGDTHYVYDFLRVSQESVQKNFAAYGLLDDQVQFLKGWFKDTLPKAPIERIAILRLDGDMYESTMDALSNLYSKVSVGGYVIVDDYCIHNCEKAVTDFRKQHGISDEIIDIDGTGVYWRRS